MYNIKFLKALADETRLNIVLQLMKKEMSVLEIVALVKKSQPNISLALKKLEEANVLERSREKRNVFYKIKDRELIEKILGMIKND